MSIRKPTTLRPVPEVVKDLTDNMGPTLLRYARSPEEFCRDILRVELQTWQKKWLGAVSQAKQGKLKQRRFAIRSGTGVGKTSGVAFIILWNIGCFPDAKVPCTAPTSPQIKAVLWPELRKWVANIPDDLKVFFPYEVTGDRVDCGQSFAVARTAREENPESFQGFHSRNTILIADEASGVPQAVYMAGQGAMSDTGALTILIGNPTRATGYFFDAFHTDSYLYWTLRVGCQDSEAVNPEYIEQMRTKHGEDSYEFKVRVLGEFHLEDAGMVIPRPWIDEAVNRAVERDSDWIVWGCDPSDGRDKFGLAKRAGNTLLEKTKAWGGKTAMQSVGMIVDEFYKTPNHLQPHEICVDAAGMGALFAGRLKEALDGERVKITMVYVQSRDKTIVGDRFTSLKVVLWNKGREWFESETVTMPPDEELMSELSAVEWEVNDSSGRWQIIDKAAGGESPARADAFLITFGSIKRGHTVHMDVDTRLKGMYNHREGIVTASYLSGES